VPKDSQAASMAIPYLLHGRARLVLTKLYSTPPPGGSAAAAGTPANSADWHAQEWIVGQTLQKPVQEAGAPLAKP
jgi:hypothetical protein